MKNMTKKRMIEILLLAAEKHRMPFGVCETLMGLNELGYINYNERLYIKSYLFKYFANQPNTAFWLSDYKNGFYADNKQGTQQRINILLDAAARVEIYGVK